MKWIYNTFRFVFHFLEVAVLAIIAMNFWVFYLTEGRSFDKVSATPPRETALVLGTSPKMKSGIANPYFTSRMEAVSLLYHHNKIKTIIVSGEKSTGYNEPKAMKEYLVYQEGIPAEIITEDPRGFSTKKSVMRCHRQYKKDNIIIISQGYHNTRALFYARNQEMNALAFNAKDITKPESFFRNQSREILARVSAVTDFLFGFSHEDILRLIK
ncbi:MAG: SanA protein [Flavobacteriales bacterium]|nr:MAG: SanA protein [Flavobacteriales bacterium]